MLGDFFDDRRNINILIYNKINDLLERLEKLNIPIYYLLGNHDVYYKNNNSLNSVELILKSFKNQILIDKPTEVNFEGKKFVMIPWINNENFKGILEYLKNKEPEIFDSYVLGHFGFEGLMPFQKNSTSLNMNYFKKFKSVFSGHYHLRVRDDNIYYIGSIIDFRWGEELSSHGFLTLNNEKISYINIENVHKKFTIRSEKDFKNVLENCNNKVIKLIITKDLDLNTNKYDYYISNIDKKCKELQVLLANDMFLNDTETENIKNIKSFEEFIKIFFKDKQYDNNINIKQLEKLFLNLYHLVEKDMKN